MHKNRKSAFCLFRSAPEFPNFLGVVIETLLSYANDKESDVRMVSDECLNRITKVSMNSGVSSAD